MREAWTDERLDDLANRVDRGFEGVGSRFDAMEARFDRFQQTMMQIGAGLIGTLVVASAGLIATQL